MQRKTFQWKEGGWGGSISSSSRSISACVFGLCVMGWGDLEQWRQSCFTSSQTRFPHMFLINIAAWQTSIKSCMDRNVFNELSRYGWHTGIEKVLLTFPLFFFFFFSLDLFNLTYCAAFSSGKYMNRWTKHVGEPSYGFGWGCTHAADVSFGRGQHLDWKKECKGWMMGFFPHLNLAAFFFSNVGIYGFGVQLFKLKAAKSTFSSSERCVAKCNNNPQIFSKNCSGESETVDVDTWLFLNTNGQFCLNQEHQDEFWTL